MVTRVLLSFVFHLKSLYTCPNVYTCCNYHFSLVWIYGPETQGAKLWGIALEVSHDIHQHSHQHKHYLPILHTTFSFLLIIYDKKVMLIT